MLVTASKEIFDSFKSSFRLKAVAHSEHELRFLDTYCNELLKNGHYIVCTKDAIELKTIDSKLVAKEELDGDVKFFWDLSGARFRELLQNMIEYRALLPHNTMKVSEASYLAVNKSDKGIFRVFTYEFDGKVIIGVEPIKGYETFFEEARAFLSGQEKIHSLFDFVKKAVSPKKKVKLDNEMSSKVAIKLLLSDMLENMREQEKGITLNIDSEFLHYYRVYLRKARSVLSQFKAVFSVEEINELRAGLSEVGRATNHARDLDVYWLKVRDYAELTKSEDFEPFLKYLKKSSDKEYEKLAKFLKSEKYKKIASDFSKITKASTGKGLKADEPVGVFARNRLRKLYKKLIQDGSGLTIDSADEKLHELRIDCKKVRYLLEFSETLFDKSKLMEAVKLIKNLQTILGNFQDLSVQQQKLVGFADDMVVELKDIKSAPLISIGRLVSDLQREQKGCKEMFLQSFAELIKPQNRDVFSDLLGRNNSENNSNI